MSIYKVPGTGLIAGIAEENPTRWFVPAFM